MCSRSFPLVALGCVLCAAAGVAQAGALNLSPEYPLVFTDFVDVGYDANGVGAYGVLTASAWFGPVLAAVDENTTIGLTSGVFELSVVIDPATGDEVSGSLLVTGNLSGGAAETLFESTSILDFGFSADDLFEITFTQQGETGLVASDSLLGVILDARNLQYDAGGSVYLPAFDQGDFYGDGFGLADTFYISGPAEPGFYIIPEPSMTALLVIASVGLLRKRKF